MSSTSPSVTASTSSDNLSPPPSPSPTTTISTFNSFPDKHIDTPPWIILHVLNIPRASEYPLRVMFSINAGHTLKSAKDSHDWWLFKDGRILVDFFSSISSNPGGNSNERPSADAPRSIWEAGKKSESLHHPNDHLLDNGNAPLLEQYKRQSRQSAPEHTTPAREFPIWMVENLCLNRTFTETFGDCHEETDLRQALTAIDYLRELESARRSALRNAAQRLYLTKTNWRSFLSNDLDALRWVEATEKNELAIEKVFASLFIDLRIWTMLHVLSAESFHKPSVIAMLNTLFPPSVGELPNERIRSTTIYRLRSSFFRCMIDVEADGRKVLGEFMHKLVSREDGHEWQEVQEHLRVYLMMARAMIEQASAIKDISSFQDKQKPSSQKPLPSPAVKSDAQVPEKAPGGNAFGSLRWRGFNKAQKPSEPDSAVDGQPIVSKTSNQTSIPKESESETPKKRIPEPNTSWPIPFNAPGSDVARNDAFLLPTIPNVPIPRLGEQLRPTSTPRVSQPSERKRTTSKATPEADKSHSLWSKRSKATLRKNSKQNNPSEDFPFLQEPYEDGQKIIKEKPSIFSLRKRTVNSQDETTGELKSLKKAASCSVLSLQARAQRSNTLNSDSSSSPSLPNNPIFVGESTPTAPLTSSVPRKIVHDTETPEANTMPFPLYQEDLCIPIFTRPAQQFASFFEASHTRPPLNNKRSEYSIRKASFASTTQTASSSGKPNCNIKSALKRTAYPNAPHSPKKRAAFDGLTGLSDVEDASEESSPKDKKETPPLFGRLKKMASKSSLFQKPKSTNPDDLKRKISMPSMQVRGAEPENIKVPRKMASFATLRPGKGKDMSEAKMEPEPAGRGGPAVHSRRTTVYDPRRDDWGYEEMHPDEPVEEVEMGVRNPNIPKHKRLSVGKYMEGE